MQRRAVDARNLAPDLVLGTVFALLGFGLTLLLFDRLSPHVYHYSIWDFWFEGDPARVVYQAEARGAYYHHTASHHPLFSFIVYAPVFILRTAFGLSVEAGVGVLLAACGAAWGAASYATLRLMGLRRLDACVFAALMVVNAAVIFHFPVPETFSFGALSLLVVILVAAYAERFGAPDWLYLAAAVVSLSVTTTNWLAGLALLWVFLPTRKAISLAVKSFVIVLALWAVQEAVFPSSDTFLNVFRSTEIGYLFNEEAQGVMPKLLVFFFHSIVIPDIGEAYRFRLSIQSALPGEGGPIAIIAVIVWTALLAIAAASWFKMRAAGPHILGSRTVAVLLLSLAAQLAVTIAFGIETFLYSAHFAPLLVLFAALGAMTAMRRVAVPLAALLAALAGYNNVEELERTRERIEARYDKERRYALELEARTEPDALVVCGVRALAATGVQNIVSREPPAVAPIEDVNSPYHPDTCAFSFDDVDIARRGWQLWYEDWSIDAIEILADRGASYFVTSNEYALAEDPAFFADLASRYREVVRTSEWAIYDLRSPPES